MAGEDVERVGSAAEMAVERHFLATFFGFLIKTVALGGQYMIKYKTNISFQLKGRDYHEDDMATV